MVEITIEGKKFDMGTISYGDFMDIQDKHTYIDEMTGKPRLLNGKATRDLVLRMVKDETGKAVDIKDEKQCSFMQGMLLDKEVSDYFSALKVKNLSGGQKQDSQSLPTGKE